MLGLPQELTTPKIFDCFNTVFLSYLLHDSTYLHMKLSVFLTMTLL